MTPRPLARAAASLAAAAALVSIALTGCGRKEPGHGDAVAELPPASVTTVRVGTAPAGVGSGSHPDPGLGLVLPARVKAAEEVTLAARFPGRLTALPVAEGASFRRGQALAAFAAPEARSALQAAGAAVAAVELRRETARLQESRMESLLAHKVASLRELEIARAERRAAEAEHDAAVAAAERLASETSVRAPFDGVVVRHHVDAGAEVGPGRPLLDIRSSGGGVEIVVAVPESELPQATGASAWVQTGDAPWREARVARVEGMIDPATRTRTAYLRPAAAGGLEPGAFARVRFAAATQASDSARVSYHVPATSFVRRGGLTGVFVVKDDHARLRWVRAGRADGDAVEVLAGLWPNDEVVVSAAGLADGRRVRVAR